ncbi:hypothetical protein, partial [Vibrio vulnificus]|uniref:hypothetical protein n=1 Tax=Vibrio vulnificus TaxID=672 RepID=UPI001F5088B7
REDMFGIGMGYKATTALLFSTQGQGCLQVGSTQVSTHNSGLSGPSGQMGRSSHRIRALL